VVFLLNAAFPTRLTAALCRLIISAYLMQWLITCGKVSFLQPHLVQLLSPLVWLLLLPLRSSRFSRSRWMNG
jgi:hypothetical protein